MIPLLIKGQAGSGKTTYLINKLNDLAQRHKRTDDILFLTLNKPNMNHVRESLNLGIDTGINITTFPRFITDELILCWPLVLKNCDEISVKEPGPVLIDPLTSHDVMRQIVERLQIGGAFPGIKATSDSISLEIMHNFSRAVSSCLDYNNISEVLIKANPDKDPSVYNDMQEALAEYIHTLLSHGLLDYGLAMHLFISCLMGNPLYQNNFQSRYRYLFADNLEESVPALANFISTFLDGFDEAYLTFSTDGGYSAVLGASPDYALSILQDRCRVENLNSVHTSSETMVKLAEALRENIQGGSSVSAPTPVRLIECEYKSEMISSAAEAVKDLVSLGLSPGDIALIAPYLDPVTEELLVSGLKSFGIPSFPLTNTGRLIDQPFIGVAVTLAMLAHPRWDIRPSHSELSGTFRTCFGMDPVRASILADAAENKKSLPHLSQKTVMRIGFKNNEKYESLLAWLSGYTEELPIDKFLERLLWDYLIPLPAARENIAATKELIDMASGYKKIMEIIQPDQTCGADFIISVKRGIKGMEVLRERPNDAVVIATPYSYLLNPLASGVQIWLDVSDKDWEDSGVRPLSNPYLFLPGWEGTWNTHIEALYSRRMLSAKVVNLLKHCKDSLVVIDCRLTPRFAEQDGMLMKYLQGTCRITP